MITRDEQLEKFKAKLDEWNADIDALEEKARAAQADMQAHYENQLATMRKARDDAQAQFFQMQNAAVEAWEAMAQGAHNAWQAWADDLEEGLEIH